MTVQHQNLASGQWLEFSAIEQLANIGSEINRAINWREKKPDYSRMAVDRALELIDLSINDLKNSNRLKEFYLLREMVVDYFYFDNKYASSDQLWQKYFDAFAYAANLQ